MNKRITWILVTLMLAAAALVQGANEPAQSPEQAQAETPAGEERPTHPFDREWLIRRARELSEQSFEQNTIPEESPLKQIDYDQYRTIVFDPNAAIWARQGRNFIVELFYPGFIFNTPVYINLVVGGTSRRVLYTSEVFSFFGEEAQRYKDVEAEGYSGFRLAYPINDDGTINEFLVFQGASYFRAVGKGQYYGLSARGLAINTARPEGEEFPYFREFWIERPKVGAEKIVVHALLDSPSVTGAYSFNIDPGDNTAVDVEAVLFARKRVEHYGIAPLTSMFLFDPMNHRRFDDFRPAVHDSEGLLMWNANGERLWRPLANPEMLQSSAFIDKNPKGFGLMQRERRFSGFEDNEAHYEKRPSLWIEPKGEWGAGHVELVEIPTAEEIYDNIVTYWQPDEALVPGEPRVFSYRMHWGSRLPKGAGDGVIVETREGAVIETGRSGERRRLFAVDFSAGEIPEGLKVNFSASAGQVGEARGEVLDSGRYRAYLSFDPQGEDVAELRMTLTNDGKQWGETWLYRWIR